MDGEEQRGEQAREQLERRNSNSGNFGRRCRRKVPEERRKADSFAETTRTRQKRRKLAALLLHVYARSPKAESDLELQGSNSAAYNNTLFLSVLFRCLRFIK